MCDSDPEIKIEESVRESSTKKKPGHRNSFWQLQENIDQLLSFSSFDQKFWDWENKNDVVEDLIDIFSNVQNYRSRRIDKVKERLFILKYLREKAGSKHHWYLYFNGIYQEDDDMLRESAKLENPYALIQYRNNESEDLGRYLRAYDLGLYKGLVIYLQKRYYPPDGDNIEYVSLDRKEMKETVTDLLSYIENLKSYEREDSDRMILQIYKSLNRMCDNAYQDEYIEYIIKLDSWYELIHDEEDLLRSALEDYVELKKEHQKLKVAYKELTELKKMDFNDMIGNQVGEYLG